MINFAKQVYLRLLVLYISVTNRLAAAEGHNTIKRPPASRRRRAPASRARPVPQRQRATRASGGGTRQALVRRYFIATANVPLCGRLPLSAAEIESEKTCHAETAVGVLMHRRKIILRFSKHWKRDYASYLNVNREHLFFKQSFNHGTCKAESDRNVTIFEKTNTLYSHPKNIASFSKQLLALHFRE